MASLTTRSHTGKVARGFRLTLLALAGACAAPPPAPDHGVVYHFRVPRPCREVYDDVARRVEACFTDPEFTELSLQVRTESRGPLDLHRVSIYDETASAPFLVIDVVCRGEASRVSVSAANHPVWQERSALAEAWAHGETPPCP